MIRPMSMTAIVILVVASSASTLAVGDEAIAGQLLRGTDRATITQPHRFRTVLTYEIS